MLIRFLKDIFSYLLTTLVMVNLKVDLTFEQVSNRIGHRHHKWDQFIDNNEFLLHDFIHGLSKTHTRQIHPLCAIDLPRGYDTTGDSMYQHAHSNLGTTQHKQQRPNVRHTTTKALSSQAYSESRREGKNQGENHGYSDRDQLHIRPRSSIDLLPTVRAENTFLVVFLCYFLDTVLSFLFALSFRLFQIQHIFPKYVSQLF